MPPQRHGLRTSSASLKDGVDIPEAELRLSMGGCRSTTARSSATPASAGSSARDENKSTSSPWASLQPSMSVHDMSAVERLMTAAARHRSPSAANFLRRFPYLSFRLATHHQ